MVYKTSLLDELEKRFKALAFIGEYKENIKQDMLTVERFNGSYIVTLGLLAVFKHSILIERTKTKRFEEGE